MRVCLFVSLFFCVFIYVIVCLCVFVYLLVLLIVCLFVDVCMIDDCLRIRVDFLVYVFVYVCDM